MLHLPSSKHRKAAAHAIRPSSQGVIRSLHDHAGILDSGLNHNNNNNSSSASSANAATLAQSFHHAAEAAARAGQTAVIQTPASPTSILRPQTVDRFASPSPRSIPTSHPHHHQPQQHHRVSFSTQPITPTTQQMMMLQQRDAQGFAVPTPPRNRVQPPSRVHASPVASSSSPMYSASPVRSSIPHPHSPATTASLKNRLHASTTATAAAAAASPISSSSASPPATASYPSMNDVQHAFLNALRSTPLPRALSGVCAPYSPSAAATTSFHSPNGKTNADRLSSSSPKIGIEGFVPSGFIPRPVSSLPYGKQSPVSNRKQLQNEDERALSPPRRAKSTSQLMLSGTASSAAVRASPSSSRRKSPPSDSLVLTDWWIDFHAPKLMFRSTSVEGGFDEVDVNQLAELDPRDVEVPNLKQFIPWVILRGYRLDVVTNDRTGEIVYEKAEHPSHSSAISIRHAANDVSTISGRRYELHGPPSASAMKSSPAGWSSDVRVAFLEDSGFPKEWKELLYRDTIHKVRRDLGLSEEDVRMSRTPIKTNVGAQVSPSQTASKRLPLPSPSRAASQTPIRPPPAILFSPSTPTFSTTPIRQAPISAPRQSLTPRQLLPAAPVFTIPSPSSRLLDRAASVTPMVTSPNSSKKLTLQIGSSKKRARDEEEEVSVKQEDVIPSASKKLKLTPAAPRPATVTPIPVGRAVSMLPLSSLACLSVNPSLNFSQIAASPKATSAASKATLLSTAAATAVIKPTDTQAKKQTDTQEATVKPKQQRKNPQPKPAKNVPSPRRSAEKPRPATAPAPISSVVAAAVAAATAFSSNSTAASMTRSGRKVQPVLNYWSASGVDELEAERTPIKKPTRSTKKVASKATSTAKKVTQSPKQAPAEPKTSDAAADSQNSLVRRVLIQKLSVRKSKKTANNAATDETPRVPAVWNESEFTRLLAAHASCDASKSTFWQDVARVVDDIAGGKDAAECQRRWTDHFAATPTKKKDNATDANTGKKSNGKSTGRKGGRKRGAEEASDDEGAESIASPSSKGAGSRAGRAPKHSLREMIERASKTRQDTANAGNAHADEGDDLFDSSPFKAVKELETNAQQGSSQLASSTTISAASAAPIKSELIEVEEKKSAIKPRSSKRQKLDSKFADEANAEGAPSESAQKQTRSLLRSLRSTKLFSASNSDNVKAEEEDEAAEDSADAADLSSANALLASKPNRAVTDNYVKSFQGRTKGGSHRLMQQTAKALAKSTAALIKNKPQLKAASGVHSQLSKQIVKELRQSDNRRLRSQGTVAAEDEMDFDQDAGVDHYFSDDNL